MDTYALLAAGGQSKPAYVRDTLHFNADAYAMLNEELTRLLHDARRVD
jgi:hypothetical protein